MRGFVRFIQTWLSAIVNSLLNIIADFKSKCCDISPEKTTKTMKKCEKLALFNFQLDLVKPAGRRWTVWFQVGSWTD